MTFSEEIRYQYDLKPESIVFDVGGYKGDFAAEIVSRYGCRVFVFEPIDDFYRSIVERFKTIHQVVPVAWAIGKDYDATPKPIYKQDNCSGEFANGQPEYPRWVGLKDAILALCWGRNLDLLKLNCEGGEYEIISDLVAFGGWSKRILNIQVQWHWCGGHTHAHYEALRDKLLVTHEVIWGDPSFHENYRLR